MAKDYSDLSEKEWEKIDPPMLPPRNVEKQMEVMKEANFLMFKAGLRHWLIDGALVCIARDGRLLDHNQDIDFAVYSEEVQPIMPVLKKMFLSAGYDTRAFKENTRLNAYKHGEMISIQGYGKKEKHPGFRFMKKYCVPEAMFEMDNEIEFDGAPYKVPYTVYSYLKRKYSNWKKEYKGDTKNKKYLNKKAICAIR